MKRIFTFIMVAVATLILQGCFGSGGSSAPPPNNVVVAAKDSRGVVTWDMAPGVEYWIFRAVGSGITPTTCSSMSLCNTTIKVTSPLTVSGLSNGTTYSFTINGRTGGGPGGAGSPAIQATPRLAGGTWSTGTSLGATTTLRGVTYGGAFVATGATGGTGALFSSTDGKTWAASTNPTAATSFNAVTYDSLRASYVSVGQGGTVAILTPSSSSSWYTQINTTAIDLFAITNNGAGFIVAAGASGKIITSSTWGTWTPATTISPATTNAFNGVTYGYDSTNARYIFVAVGVAGSVYYSIDGVNWIGATSGTANNLMSVTYGADAGVFVAVGASGTVLTSPDGIAWATKPATSIPGATLLNSVTYSAGRRFVAVANDGSIYYSEYASVAATWTQAIPPSATALNAVITGGYYDFSAVGAAGANLYSD